MSCARIRSRQGLAIALILLLGALGCGPRFYTVRGKVTYPDGTALTEGMVVFESKGDAQPVMARGEIQPDGSYELGTVQPRDGVAPGTYRVLVAPKTDPNAVDKRQTTLPFDARFMDFATSDLVFEVKTQANDFPITVTKTKKPA
jgi:hypothetical protein